MTTKKETLKLNEERFTAVYFVEHYRIMTYGAVTRTEIMIQLERLQRGHNVAIGLYTIPQDEAELMGSIDCERHENVFLEKIAQFRRGQ